MEKTVTTITPQIRVLIVIIILERLMLVILYWKTAKLQEAGQLRVSIVLVFILKIQYLGRIQQDRVVPLLYDQLRTVRLSVPHLIQIVQDGEVLFQQVVEQVQLLTFLIRDLQIMLQ